MFAISFIDNIVYILKVLQCIFTPVKTQRAITVSCWCELPFFSLGTHAFNMTVEREKEERSSRDSVCRSI